jgi:hypothetical protein
MKILPFKAWLLMRSDGLMKIYSTEKEANYWAFVMSSDQKATITPVLITEVKKKK